MKQRPIKIVPSILSADFSILKEEIKKVEQAKADMIHIDIMDGHFVPNISIGPAIVGSIRKVTDLPFDLHLMVEDPSQYIKSFVDAGADIISVHLEREVHLHRTLDLIKSYNRKAAVVLNPHTPISGIEEIVECIDMVLLMSVNPGFAGQKMIESVLKKAEALRKFLDSSGYPDIDIEMDGGINSLNASKVIASGVNILVAGSAIFGSSDYAEAISSLR